MFFRFVELSTAPASTPLVERIIGIERLNGACCYADRHRPPSPPPAGRSRSPRLGFDGNDFHNHFGVEREIGTRTSADFQHPARQPGEVLLSQHPPRSTRSVNAATSPHGRYGLAISRGVLDADGPR